MKGLNCDTDVSYLHDRANKQWVEYALWQDVLCRTGLCFQWKESFSPIPGASSAICIKEPRDPSSTSSREENIYYGLWLCDWHHNITSWNMKGNMMEYGMLRCSLKLWIRSCHATVTDPWRRYFCWTKTSDLAKVILSCWIHWMSIVFDWPSEFGGQVKPKSG